MKSAFALKIRDYLDTPEKKAFYNREHFTESAPRYDIATRLMSFGQDAGWKKKLIEHLPDYVAPACLDLATGTGDIAIALAQKYPTGTVFAIDLTEAMLSIARTRKGAENVTFECGSIDSLPYADDSLKVITGSYALRNSPDLQLTLNEIHRCLAPGGTAAILDFSKPDSAFMQKIQHVLLKYWGSMWGLILHGNAEVHGYISASLAVYPERRRLDTMIRAAGFSKIARKTLFLGMIELIFLTKQP